MDAASLDAPTRARRRILIVEDDPGVRAFLDTFLTRRGMVTLVAANAEAADALLLDLPDPPQVAIVDMRLPGRDGLSYADSLRQRYADIRLVFISGWQEGIDVAAAESRGRLIIKPFTTQQLIEALG
jgi:DNA-binding response OmpR family regulator